MLLSKTAPGMSALRGDNLCFFPHCAHTKQHSHHSDVTACPTDVKNLTKTTPNLTDTSKEHRKQAHTLHQPALGCYAVRKSTRVAMTMSLHHHSVHSSGECSKPAMRTHWDRKTWVRARASPCCGQGGAVVTAQAKHAGLLEAFIFFLLMLWGSTFSPGASQMTPCLMSVTTAMDRIQISNPFCVRWQHPPPLAAPREQQQPGEACKEE